MVQNKKPEVCLIVAHTESGLIGKDGGLPWKCSVDMKHFKDTTANYPVIVGPTTALSMPRFPLQNRPGGILSKSIFANYGNSVFICTYDGDNWVGLPKDGQKFFAAHDTFKRYRHSAPSFVFKNIHDITDVFSNHDKIFIAGGAAVYKSALQSGIVDTIYRTVLPDIPGVTGDKYLDTDTLTMMNETNFTLRESLYYEYRCANTIRGTDGCYIIGGYPTCIISGNESAPDNLSCKPTDTPFPWIKFQKLSRVNCGK